LETHVVTYEARDQTSRQQVSRQQVSRQQVSREAGERRRAELGKFLKARRATLSPGDFGMPPGSRRRTPGLRREEVALLAGVGVTWYTWLEQGRQINASTQVLDAVARTLPSISDSRNQTRRPVRKWGTPQTWYILVHVE
jgi:Helix-turn-helix domain